ITRFTTSATRCKSVSRSSVVLSTSATSTRSDSTSTRCGGVVVAIGSTDDNNSSRGGATWWKTRVVVQFESFFASFTSFTDRHLEGRKRARVLGSPFAPAFGVNGQISGRVALRDLMFEEHKVPRPYSGALPIYAQERRANGDPDCAPSLTGTRDDEF